MDEPIEASEERPRFRALAIGVGIVVVVVAAVIGFGVEGDDAELDPEQRLVTITTESCGSTAGGIGSGVLVGGDLAVTVAHVALTGGDVSVTTVDGSVVVGELVGLDRTADIAVLRLPGFDAPGVEFHEFAAGEAVRIVGGQSGDVDGVAVRAVDITIEEVGGTDRVVRDGYELEADLVKGDSGAGVFSGDGGLGGIVFAVSRRTGGVTWISDASEVRDLLDGELQPLICDPDRGYAVPVS